MSARITSAWPGTTITVPHAHVDAEGESHTYYLKEDVAAIGVWSSGDPFALTNEGRTVPITGRCELTVASLVHPPAGTRIPEPWVWEGALYVDWLPVVAIDLATGEALALDGDGCDVRSTSFVVPGVTTAWQEELCVRDAIAARLGKHADPDLERARSLLDERITGRPLTPYLDLGLATSRSAVADPDE